MKYDFDIINNIIHSPTRYLTNFYKEHQEYIDEINKIKKNYAILDNINFNIFSSISESYYKENYHSDILKYILDPNTEKLGNNNFVIEFIRFINKIEPKVKINLSGNVHIERETNKIDLFMYDDNMNGIIIENKINWAKDQKNQLGRYYTKMLEKGFKIDAIIYLTLTPEKDIDINYSVINKELRADIINILKKVSVINYNGKICFANNFIDNCIKHTNNELQRVYISEYSEIIKYLGGTFMSNGLDKQTLIEIYGDQERLNAFNICGELWSRKKDLIFEMIRERLMDELNFTEHPEDKKTVYKKVSDNTFIAFHKDSSFGFVSPTYKKKIPTDIRKKLKTILEDFTSGDKYFYEDDTGENDHWVYMVVNMERLNIVGETINKFAEFEKVVKKSKL